VNDGVAMTTRDACSHLTRIDFSDALACSKLDYRSIPHLHHATTVSSTI